MLNKMKKRSLRRALGCVRGLNSTVVTILIRDVLVGVILIQTEILRTKSILLLVL